MAATPFSAGSTEAPQAGVVAFLSSSEAFGGLKPEQIETHAARVFLVGDRAWKMKRAVRYPYLDFSTLEQRHAALSAELVLNRRTAPDLYCGLSPVTRDRVGRLRIGGVGEPVEWLLAMRRFPQSALFSELAARHSLDEQLMTGLTDHVVAFYRSADPLRCVDGASRLREVITGNRESLERCPTILAARACAKLLERQLRLLQRHALLLDARAAAGRIRHCHGDLHLGNIALVDGEPTLFDCLEFDSQLATIDVLYDLAFLLMDLWEKGLRAQANFVANRYLDLSAEDEPGIVLLPLMMSIRATIRAHVSAAIAGHRNDRMGRIANAYLRLAARLLQAKPAVLIAIGGLSGTGKSTLARALAPKIGYPPGARVIRTDVIRKRLAGIPPETRLPRASYTAAASHETYSAAFALAQRVLKSRCSVIFDAVFADVEEREAARRLATATAVRWQALWLEAPLGIRIARVGGRARDASDADPAVLRGQSSPRFDELEGWHPLDATNEVTQSVEVTEALLAALPPHTIEHS